MDWIRVSYDRRNGDTCRGQKAADGHQLADHHRRAKTNSTTQRPKPPCPPTVWLPLVSRNLTAVLGSRQKRSRMAAATWISSPGGVERRTEKEMVCQQGSKAWGAAAAPHHLHHCPSLMQGFEAANPIVIQ